MLSRSLDPCAICRPRHGLTETSLLTSRHHFFKSKLIEHFKRRNEQNEMRNRYMTETYTKMMATWTKKVERMENSKKRKEKEAKARELYEKIFPELRKQREDKERDHRLGTRGAVRSEADMEDVIERLQEQEVSQIEESRTYVAR